jgi:predicted  nucleic acid-binding Zn-ribbon protein
MIVVVYAINGKLMGNRKEYKLNTDIFIQRSTERHAGKYDYSKSVYVNKRSKVCIICPIHGEFFQTAANHMRGQGCPACGKKYASEWRKGKWNDFVSESKSRFGDIYDFPFIKNEYENSHSKITIKCNRCGNTFIKIACDHLTSPHGGCLNCYSNTSYEEKELSDYIVSLLGEESVILHDSTILEGKEIDIYIPSKNIAIEYDGLYWHSDEQKADKYYHLKKTDECARKGIKLIHVFEDEFIKTKDIVKEKIKHLLGCKKNHTHIMARKCIISSVSRNVAKEFLKKYHIQGFSPSTIHLGCFYNNEVIGVMSFKKEKDEGKWELTRFATDYNYICNGVGGKLFSYFVKKYRPKEVKSFADRRWTIDENNLYIKLGFKLDKILLPDYKYIIGNNFERHHKFNFRKKILHKKYGLPLTMTESEMAKSIKAHKIWDCGLLRYVWAAEN